jgi:two-component system, LytTR family, response regulator
MSYSVVIVEDEPPARAKLERFIAELEDFRLAGHADTVDAAVAEIGYLSSDVVYLDVQLGTRSGFEVVEGLRGITKPLIVFTTAYSEYAVKAFEIQALDYLLKPFDRERFLQSVTRDRAAMVEPDRSDFEERVRRLLAGIPGRPPPAKQILVRTGERAFFLDVADIQRVGGGKLRRGPHRSEEPSDPRVADGFHRAARPKRIPTGAPLACRTRGLHS